MSASLAERVRTAIRVFPNFPVPGVPFYDVSSVLRDPALVGDVIDKMVAPFKDARVGKVIGLEARGFYFAPMVALRLGAAFIPARKPGKLPGKCESGKAQIENDMGVVGGSGASPVFTYRKDYEFELQADAISLGDDLIVADDLLAKGGSALAVSEIAERKGARIAGCVFLIDIPSLNGARWLAPRPVHVIASIG